MFRITIVLSDVVTKVGTGSCFVLGNYVKILRFIAAWLQSGLFRNQQPCYGLNAGRRQKIFPSILNTEQKVL